MIERTTVSAAQPADKGHVVETPGPSGKQSFTVESRCARVGHLDVMQAVRQTICELATMLKSGRTIERLGADETAISQQNAATVRNSETEHSENQSVDDATRTSGNADQTTGDCVSASNELKSALMTEGCSETENKLVEKTNERLLNGTGEHVDDSSVESNSGRRSVIESGVEALGVLREGIVLTAREQLRTTVVDERLLGNRVREDE